MNADLRWMGYALRLGRRALGTTLENPPVGCVVVRDGRVLGVGWTQPGGRPHAETEALEMAGEQASGATAYVTLEPCAHHGRTGPCAEALARAGITRVHVVQRVLEVQATELLAAGGSDHGAGGAVAFQAFFHQCVGQHQQATWCVHLSLIHISEPTRLLSIPYAVFCLTKKTLLLITHNSFICSTYKH